MCDWREAQASVNERSAKTCDQFPTLQEAYLADAKNYRAMAKQGREALKTHETS